MNRSVPALLLASFVFFGTPLLANAAAATDPIEGNWVSRSGHFMFIAPCLDGFCLVPRIGSRIGKVYGHFKPISAGVYQGEIQPSKKDVAVSATAKIKGNTLVVTTCLAKKICMNVNWVRQ